VSSLAGLVTGFRKRSGEQTFLDRLDDFRGRLIRAVVVVVLASGVGFYIVMRYDVLGVFTAPVQPYLDGEKLKYLSPTDPFFITLKLGISLGFVAALPYLLHQLWGLVSPLMRPSERRLAIPALFASVLLFAVGAVFCYIMVIPLMLQFTMGFQTESLQQAVVIGEYLAIVLRMLIAFGLAFELPIVVLLGTLLGVVTPDFLASRRRYALAIMVVLSAIITPPDLSSQVLLLIPVWILYEASIVLSRVVLARRQPLLSLPDL